MSTLITIDGEQYVMGTRIKVSDIQQILGDPSDRESVIKDYIRTQGVIVTEEFVKKVISEIEGLVATSNLGESQA